MQRKKYVSCLFYAIDSLYRNFRTIEWVDKSDAKRLLRRIRFNAVDER